MRKIVIILMIAGAGLLAGCQDYFLQKPDTTGTYDLPTIYSSRENAFTILVSLYNASLRHGWPGSTGLNHSVLGEISGERSRGYDWESAYTVTSTGLSPIYRENYVNNGADKYQEGFNRIRACYLLIQNIDAVPDMEQPEKELWKAEAYGLIAFRYMGMFYRYGGVPKVEKAFDPAGAENMNLPRMTLQETLDFTLELLQKAYDGLPEGERPAAEKGRLTRGAVLAMKARLLMFAARPLFNSAAPYRNLSGNNNLICFGEEDQGRWTAARDANLAVLTWANSNGYRLLKQAGEGVANTFEQAANDYGNATSQPSNPEALLQLKQDSWDETLFINLLGAYPLVSANSGNGYVNDKNGMLTNLLEKYWMRTGEDVDLPKVGAPARTGVDWETRVNNLEARCLVDWLLPATGDHIAHPGDRNFRQALNKPVGNSESFDNYPNSYDWGMTGRAVKFWAFRNVAWTELPIFRLAETYLNLAEAYNELDDETNALKYLNEIHLRAGLPALSITGKEDIRKAIQRERAVELQGENHRYFDAKHWKIADIADGGLAGPMRELQFYRKANWIQFDTGQINTYWDAVTYNSFWADYMYLEPFPLDEVNKGAIIQNPGY